MCIFFFFFLIRDLWSNHLKPATRNQYISIIAERFVIVFKDLVESFLIVTIAELLYPPHRSIGKDSSSFPLFFFLIFGIQRKKV